MAPIQAAAKRNTRVGGSVRGLPSWEEMLVRLHFILPLMPKIEKKVFCEITSQNGETQNVEIA